MAFVRALPALIGLLAAGLAAPGAAADSGLPVPRFVSLASDEVNLRTGPGRQYPVEWVFVREALPVEVVGEFDVWRRVRDRDGVEGWVHHSLLSGRRSVLLQGEGRIALRAEPDNAAPAPVLAEAGVLARLMGCPPPADDHGGWCEVEIAGHRGWLPRGDLWGVYPDEEVRR